MIFARRLVSEDDRGDISEDYEGVAVPRSAKICLPFDPSSRFSKRRAVKVRAVRELKKAGLTIAEIAVAVELSERHVKRYWASVRDFAEAIGRV